MLAIAIDHMSLGVANGDEKLTILWEAMVAGECARMRLEGPKNSDQ